VGRSGWSAAWAASLARVVKDHLWWQVIDLRAAIVGVDNSTQEVEAT
jgi:hypothetical protein